MKRTCIPLLALATLAFPTLAQHSNPADGPTGGCQNVVGISSIRSTSDEGASWSQNRRPLEFGQATFGIAGLSTGNWVTELQGRLYRSSNGCRWSPLAPAPLSPLRLTAGSGDEALAFGFFPGPQIWRIRADGHGQSAVEALAPLPADVLTVAADHGDSQHLRVVGRNGRIYDSTNAGASWTALGRAAPVTGLVYFAALDPNDLDHALIGMVLGGVVCTFDGGASWTSAGGLSASGGSVNGFNGVISPASSSVAYVMALDLDQIGSGDPSDGRHIFRSDDGGLTFVPVVDQGNGVVLTNGPVMEPHPTDAGVLYFPFGSRFAGGTSLYRYDHASGTTSSQFTTDFVQIRSLAVDPLDPGRVLAGIEG